MVSKKLLHIVYIFCQISCSCAMEQMYPYPVSPTLQQNVITPALEQGTNYKLPQQYLSSEKLVEIIKAADLQDMCHLHTIACTQAVTYIKEHADVVLKNATLWRGIDAKSARIIATALMQNYVIKEQPLWHELTIPIDSLVSKLFSSRTPTSVVYSPDGNRIFCGMSDGTIWSKKGDQPLTKFSQSSKKICALVMPNDKIVISGSAHGDITVWDSEHAKLLHTIKAHTKAIRTLVYKPDCEFFISMSDDTTLFWDFDASDSSLTLKFTYDDRETSVVLDVYLGVKRMVTLHADGSLIFYNNVKKGQGEYQYNGDTRKEGPFVAMLVIKDAHALAVATGGSMKLFDLADNDTEGRGDLEEKSLSYSLRATYDEKFVLIGFNTTILLFEVRLDDAKKKLIKLVFLKKWAQPTKAPLVNLILRPDSYEFVVMTQKGIGIVNPEFPQFNLEQIIFICAVCKTQKIDMQHPTYLAFTQDQRTAVAAYVEHASTTKTTKKKHVLEKL